MSEELKPCPFCGGEARLYPVIMPFDADCDTITIQCGECDAVGANVMVDQDVHTQSDLPSLEAEAIEAWNCRAATADTIEAQAAEIEELKSWKAAEDAHHHAMRAEIKRLREALEQITDIEPDPDNMGRFHDIAHAALGGTK